MRTSRFPHRLRSFKSPRAATDDLLDAYVAWRAAALRVRAAYTTWEECANSDRDPAFAVYLATLDREEHAAGMYAAQIDLVRELIAAGGA
jgi:hypothetical protein